MEDAGVIEFDGREVVLTDRGKEVEVYMEVVPGNSIPWGDYYLGLSLISAVVVAGVFLGVYPESVPDVAWAAVIVVAFGLSSAYHSYRSRRMRLGIPEKPPEIGSGPGSGGDRR